MASGKPGQGKSIQITIDDAPGSANASMRALLAKHRIKTMFFVEGEFVEKRPQDIVAMVRSGHRLGLHTWDHPQLTKMTDAKIKDEFIRTDALVKKLTGKSMAPNWRPPYGAFNDRVKQAAAAVGFTKMWLWDVDSLDWKYQNRTLAIVDEVENGLVRCRKQKCVVLFHDKATTVTALEVLLPRLVAEGYALANFP